MKGKSYFRIGLAFSVALTILLSACGSNPAATTSQTQSSQPNSTVTTPPTETVTYSASQPSATSKMPETTLQNSSTPFVTPTTSAAPSTIAKTPVPTTTAITPTWSTVTTLTPTTSAAETSSALPSTTVRVDYMNTPVDKKELVSYRYSVLLRIDEGNGAVTSVTYMSEWLREPRAEHVWKEDASGKVTELYIAIGAERWSFVDGQGWMKQQVEFALPASISDQVKIAIKDPAAAKASVVKKVLESVNGVYCTPFEIEYTIESPVLDLASGKIETAQVHFTGMVYLADQLGWEFVMMFARGTTEMTIQGKKTVVYTEQKVYDVGGDITITAP
jgi:hypothetical protein